MANLLPLAQKHKVRKEYKMRRMIVMFALAAFLFSAGIVLLVPQYIALSIRERVANEEAVSIKDQIAQKTETDPEEIISETNSRINSLTKPPAAGYGAYDIFMEITDGKSDDIGITGMFYNFDNNEMKVTVNGIAKNRKSLSGFAGVLESKKIFYDTELPISNFVKEEDIDFALTLKVNTENGN